MRTHTFFTLALSIVILGACGKVEEPAIRGGRTVAAPYAVYYEGLLGNIEPQGWLREYLERQNSGLTGHPKALSYPYNTCLWAGKIHRVGPWGAGWWRYEQTAYYTDGLLRLGYALADSTLIAKGENGVNYTLDHVATDGILGVHDEFMLSDDGYAQWPHAVFFRVMQAMYQATGDERIPAALEKHYLAFPPERYKDRSAVNIEGILWTYALTGNGELLTLAEKIWDRGDFYLNQRRCISDEPVHQHGVTYCEEMKLPMLLYAFTGKQGYLDAAIHADSLMESANMLPDGVPSSAEWFAGQNPIHSHETCDITDYTWTLGYYLMTTGDARWADRIEKAVLNAGIGCVTKDFRDLQYLSSVNQFIATGTSNNNEFMKGRSWMAYRPTHQTECCAGNVHRIMPNYVSRMWLRGAWDELVAALYGPSKVSVRLEDGTVCSVTEDTQWPFSDGIKFRFEFSRDGRRVRSHQVKFTYRIPEGCTLHGVSGPRFISCEKQFRSGETLSLDFDTEPVIKPTEGGVYVQRGPLVYALPIEAEVSIDTVKYDYMHGKYPDEPGFDCLNMTPASRWNWCVAADVAPRFKRSASFRAYPWEASPLTISLHASGVEGWDLAEGIYTCEAPDPVITTGEDETLTLVPYGCTTLRLTVFPIKE